MVSILFGIYVIIAVIIAVGLTLAARFNVWIVGLAFCWPVILLWWLSDEFYHYRAKRAAKTLKEKWDEK